MVSCRFGGIEGHEVRLVDNEDVVVIRTQRQGARHDISPLAARTRRAQRELAPLFGFPAAGVGVWEAPRGRAEELATVIHQDDEVRFAGRGLRDAAGAPVVYTENVFVQFAEGTSATDAESVLAELGLQVKRPLSYAPGAFFAEAAEGTGRDIFAKAEALLERDDVELCHPELIREIGWNAASPEQWHLTTATVDGTNVDAHANVTAAWELTDGAGIVIAVIDDGMDMSHEEFASDGKLVAPQSITRPRSDDPSPAAGDQHGMACSGVACANGAHGASGVAPGASLMPLRLVSGIGSQDEADAFAYAADNGADVISCSWGPRDGDWEDDNDPVHDQVVPLPDSTRLALNHAVANGRDGKGCVITWAAGNGNESVENDGYASYEKVIAVAACSDTSVRSVYSDMGDAVWCCFPSSNFNGNVTPGIWTTDRPGRDGYNPGDVTMGDPAGNYTNSFGGTSSACPGVAGVVALMLARNPNLTAAEVKEALKGGCDRIDEANGNYDADGHSDWYGFGRVNARKAVEAAASS